MKYFFGYVSLIILLTVNDISVVNAGAIEISGFASVAMGKVISGDEALTDYPKAGIYDTDWSFAADSSIGLQLVAQVNEKTSFVIQAVSHGAVDFDIKVDWAYINYNLSPELTLQFGRKRLPLYYYSDYFDIAYTYYWIRPPSDNYTWQITNYNGVSLSYEPKLAEWDALFNVYFGREDSEDNELLSTLSNSKVDETWKNMFGLVAELSRGWIDFRLTYMQGQLDRNINEVTVEENIKQHFYGLSINLAFENLIVLSELNRYERPSNNIQLDTHMISIGYQIHKFTPHITHSKLIQTINAAGGDEEHYTNSVGIRWDLEENMALKIQYDKINDKGKVINILQDAELLTLSLDLVF